MYEQSFVYMTKNCEIVYLAYSTTTETQILADKLVMPYESIVNI